MTRFEVWKRKDAKERKKREQSNIKEIGDYIRSTYPERMNKPQ